MTTSFFIRLAMIAPLARFCWAGPASSLGPVRLSEDSSPLKESWSTLNMEAKAIMGELKYQHGDYSAAQETFRDSLNSSTLLTSPHSQLMGLDLFRSAQLSARNGDFEGARKHLEILLHRFPGSEWSVRGRELFEKLPLAPVPEEDRLIENFEPVLTEERPEIYLERLQSALKDGQDEQASSLCRLFLEKFVDHGSAMEVRLAAGALALKLRKTSSAVQDLGAVAQTTSDPELRSKASYLLAAAYWHLDDRKAVLQTVPQDPAGDSWLILAQIWRAAAYNALGRTDSAMALYRLIISETDSPAKAYALAAVAEDWARRAKMREASQTLERAAREAARWDMPDLEASLTLSQAHALYRLRRLREAAKLYGDFARRQPDHPASSLALYQRGLTLRRLGLKEEAVSSFSRLVERNPLSPYAPQTHLQLGQLYGELGAAEKSIGHYRNMAVEGEKTSQKESLLLVAQVHYNAKRYREAIPLYRHFLEKYGADPRRQEIEELLLTSYWLGDRDNPDLVNIVQLYPRHPIVAHIRWELGGRAYREGDHRKAVSLFSHFAADFPRSPKAAESLFYRGESLMKLGDPRGAAQAYQDLLGRYPRHDLARQAAFRRGAALYEAGDYEAGAKSYGTAIEGAGDALAADSLFNQALAYSKAGSSAKALAAYERLVLRFPRHSQAAWTWFKIGQMRETASGYQAAILAYSRVPRTDERHVQALFNIGRLYEKHKQTGSAVGAYERLKAATPPAHPARVHGLLRLGLLQELAGKPQKALPLYREVVKWGANGGADSQTAQKRLKALLSDKDLAQNP